MLEPIQIMQTRTTRRAFRITDRYEFWPSGRLAFLSRWAFSYLRRRDHLQQAWGEDETFTRTVIDREKLIDALCDQHQEVMRLIGREGMTVCLGPDDYSELMGDPNIFQYLEFPAQVYRNRRLLGLTVKIVPWMRGVLVLP